MRTRFALALLLWSCTRNNPDYCDQDSDCHDAAKPFCDVNGEYQESDHTKNTCTSTPVGCPLDRCGCTPGEGLSCSNDELTYCAEDGRSSSTQTCALGCSASESRCLEFNPANGLASALAQAAGEPDVTLSAGTTIDTTAGVVKNSGGNPIALASVLVPQTGTSTMIRAYLAKSFTIDGVVATGTHSLAFVSPGSIAVVGMLDASATGLAAGPGARDVPDQCAAPDVPSVLCAPMTILLCNDGAGGGGNVTAGGAGGGESNAGGAPGTGVATLSNLVGGCRGGTIDTSGGGAGGGAVQLSSSTSILLTATGVINVGGGGGQNGRGGGSGGNVVLEAPHIRIEGTSAGITANGGAGGGCGMSGEDGRPTAISAGGPQCGSLSAGSGANGSNPPSSGTICTSNCPTSSYQYGGGGGALGRAQLATRDGTYEQVGNPIISVAVTAAPLTTH